MRSTGRGAALAATLAICVVTLPSASAAPAEHFTIPVAGDELVCDDTTYSLTSGAIKVVLHEGVSASGNTNFTGTVTARHVMAEDPAGNVYSVRGTEWFGATSNARRGTFQATFTAQLQVIARGTGTVDRVRVTSHITSVNGNVKEFDFGTCEAP